MTVSGLINKALGCFLIVFQYVPLSSYGTILVRIPHGTLLVLQVFLFHRKIHHPMNNFKDMLSIGTNYNGEKLRC